MARIAGVWVMLDAPFFPSTLLGKAGFFEGLVVDTKPLPKANLKHHQMCFSFYITSFSLGDLAGKKQKVNV